MNRARGFTLIEIAISTFILMLLLLLALPSISGVMADRRLKRSLDALNQLVRSTQQHSMQEHRPYVIEWRSRLIAMHPAALNEGEPDKPTAVLPLEKGYAYILRLPSALEKGPFAQWTFWPSGVCEPAVVQFKGPPGDWEVNYSALTASPQILRYATK